MKRIANFLFLLSSLGIILLVSFLPLPVPFNMDFLVIYNAGRGLLHGIPLYDHVGQVQMIAELAGITPEQVIAHPFPYPPWYGLIAMGLAKLPIYIAARLWFALNIVMLLQSVVLLTGSWKPLLRMIILSAMLIFPPVLGALWVGQYVFPVLFGLSLLIYALRRESPLLTALAAAFLTFKPHLGGLVLLVLLIYLWFQKDDFSRRAFWLTVAIGLFLFAIGFLADPAWPTHYFQSLTGYGQIPGVQTCGLCVSLPVMLSGNRLSVAFWIAGLMIIGALVWLFLNRTLLLNRYTLVISMVLTTLLVSPYLLNYDFVLLVIPFVFLTGWASDWRARVFLAVAYFLPWIGLLFGRQGNLVLLISTFCLVLLFWLQSRNVIHEKGITSW